MANLANDELESILSCLNIIHVADINQRDDLGSPTHLSAEGFVLKTNICEKPGEVRRICSLLL